MQSLTAATALQKSARPQCCKQSTSTYRVWRAAVTRNASTAPTPAPAPEESPAFADLGELVVSQGSANSSVAVDAVPAPASKSSLPHGELHLA